MIASLIFVVVAAGVGVASPAWGQLATARNSCVDCHLTQTDDWLVKPAREFGTDIHATKGFTCPACHGGDPHEPGETHAMDPAKGYIGKPKRQQLAQVCGRCHSDARFMKQYNPSLRIDQVAEYAASVHGRRLVQLNDAKVATCVSCHAAHTIKPPSDPASTVHPLKVADTCGRCHADAKYMADYRIPTDQLAHYKQSTHWRAMTVKGDLSAPTCNDCHGNHGAAPPGVSWVGNVCGQCHAVMADFFKTSIHARVFRDIGSPGCATCHDKHGIQEANDGMLGVDGAAVCGACHTRADRGGQTALAMRAEIDALNNGIEKARTPLARAEYAGIEVSQAQFDLKGAEDALVKARAAVHTFVLDAVKREVAPGIAVTAKAYARGLQALDEVQFRRKGLGVSLVIIAAMIIGLVLKIREIDRRRRSTETDT